jgi:hypothetical protein
MASARQPTIPHMGVRPPVYVSYCVRSYRGGWPGVQARSLGCVTASARRHTQSSRATPAGLDGDLRCRTSSSASIPEGSARQSPSRRSVSPSSRHRSRRAERLGVFSRKHRGSSFPASLHYLVHRFADWSGSRQFRSRPGSSARCGETEGCLTSCTRTASMRCLR